MIITYCEKCGTLIHVKHIVAGEVCKECKAGGAAPRKGRVPRHSDMIPRKKLERKKQKD